MNEFALFDFQGHDVRTFSVEGVPWFVARDVAVALGYADPTSAMKQHIDSDDIWETRRSEGVVNWHPFHAQVNSIKLTNESGVYSLIFGSKLGSARALKRWVTSEVLPTLRQHGVYVDPSSTKDDAYIEAEVQRQLQKRQYKVVVRDTLKAVGARPGWQYGEVHNIVLLAVCGMKAPELLAAGRDLQTWAGDKPRKADHAVATNYLFADELELFNIITDAVSTDTRFRRPRTYREFVTVVREAADRYTCG